MQSCNAVDSLLKTQSMLLVCRRFLNVSRRFFNGFLFENFFRILVSLPSRWFPARFLSVILPQFADAASPAGQFCFESEKLSLQLKRITTRIRTVQFEMLVGKHHTKDNILSGRFATV